MGGFDDGSSFVGDGVEVFGGGFGEGVGEEGVGGVGEGESEGDVAADDLFGWFGGDELLGGVLYFCGGLLEHLGAFGGDFFLGVCVVGEAVGDELDDLEGAGGLVFGADGGAVLLEEPVFEVALFFDGGLDFGYAFEVNGRGDAPAEGFAAFFPGVDEGVVEGAGGFEELGVVVLEEEAIEQGPVGEELQGLLEVGVGAVDGFGLLPGEFGGF